MGDPFRPRESGNGDLLWLSMLIDAMEEAGRPESRALPCDRSVLAAVAVQLARPVSPYAHRASSFSFRNQIALRAVAHSPAICSRGRLSRSSPRSLASSRAT